MDFQPRCCDINVLLAIIFFCFGNRIFLRHCASERAVSLWVQNYACPRHRSSFCSMRLTDAEHKSQLRQATHEIRSTLQVATRFPPEHSKISKHRFRQFELSFGPKVDSASLLVPWTHLHVTEKHYGSPSIQRLLSQPNLCAT